MVVYVAQWRKVVQNRTPKRKAYKPMADSNPAGSISSILAELRDTNKDKRRLAVMKLGMVGGDDAVKTLIRLLDDPHEDLIVRGRAALLLGKVGDASAVMPLIRALEAPGYQTPMHAAESLGLIGDTRAIDPLLAIANNSRDRLREAAVTALKRLGRELPEKDSLSQPHTEAEPEL